MQRVVVIFRVVAIVLALSTAWPIHAIAPFQDVPAEEAHVGDGIPKAGTLFDRPSVFGRSDSHVVVIDLEDFKVVARHSANQGTTFDPGVLLAGGMGQPDAEFFRASQGLDGTVYVALAIVDPLGGIGLQVARTLDMGQTWSAPVDIIRHGNPLHDIVPAEYRLAVAAGTAGRVAVLFANEFHGRHYVVSSVDYGQTWTTPVRVDPGASEPKGSNYFASDVAIAPNGSIHVVYVQARGTTKLLYTRSTDGGVTFEAERAINSVAFPTYPDMEIASDGGVLIAQPTGGTMVVLRSTNDGVSFGSSTLVDGDSNRYRTPVIRSAPGTTEVFLVCPSQLTSDPPAREGPLRVWRSTDNGATFGSAPVDLASRVYRGATVAIQRTPSGAWAVAWMDTQADTYAYVMADVKVVVSLDGGATWGAAKQVHSGAPGSSARTLLPTGMAASSSDELVFAWTDGRDDNSRSRAVYLNRASAHALAFGADWRLAQDTSLVNAEMIDPDVTTDGVSSVYTAFGAVGRGPFPEIFVASSSDSGHTFGPPVRAASWQGGSVIEKLPKVLARPGGKVYVLSQIENAFGSRYLFVSRSNDYGATWSTLSSLGPVATPCAPTILCGDPSLEDPQFVLGPPGKLYVSWTDRIRIYVSRSTDDGATFTTVNVSPSFDFFPNYVSALCVHGDQVVASYIGYDTGGGEYFPFGTVSPDGGVNWSSPVRLSSTLYGADYFGGLTCAGDSNGGVLVAWSAFAANERIFFNRWDGYTWGVPDELPAPPGLDLFIPSALITSASHVLVTYGSSQNEIYASRSNDGGHTFAAYQRLDDAAPVPGAISGWPYAATDAQGRVWVAWYDFSSGVQGATAIRFSVDDGATFGPAYRLNRNEPQGGHYHFGFWLNSHVATLPGVAFAAYPTESRTRRNDIFVNAFEPGDFDRDLVPAISDCNDSNPGAKAIPTAVAALLLGGGGGTVLSWTSQSGAAGRGTVYDVVTGVLSEMRAEAGFARAVCLGSGLVGASYLDTRAGPVPDDGVYYLVRARNGCGLGTFGEGSAPRDALDASGICP